MTDEDITILEDNGANRRVEEVSEVRYDSAEDVVWLQAGDEIQPEDGYTSERILEIGDGLSDSGGIHARTKPSHGDEERIVHLNLIREMIDRDGTVVVGKRTRRFTQVEGTDY